MLTKEILIMGAVGAVSIMVGRKIDALAPVYVTGPEKFTTIPIPSIAPKDGFGMEWILIPAVAAYFLSK